MNPEYPDSDGVLWRAGFRTRFACRNDNIQNSVVSTGRGHLANVGHVGYRTSRYDMPMIGVSGKSEISRCVRNDNCK
ncbi:MAG: hypothetical protein SFU91_13520 [Chloroherpetonaceae bacterium]|nr:hypothetical protein [Chloroherpetonaceae bacterium]